MSDVHCITFNPAFYDLKEDLFKDVNTIMRVLADNGYICSFEFKDNEMYVLGFDRNNNCCDEYELKWVKTEEGT